MLQIFLLIPISLNGILPVIFAYFLLVSHTSNPGHDKLGPAILTAVVYILFFQQYNGAAVRWRFYPGRLVMSSDSPRRNGRPTSLAIAGC